MVQKPVLVKRRRGLAVALEDHHHLLATERRLEHRLALILVPGVAGRLYLLLHRRGLRGGEQLVLEAAVHRFTLPGHDDDDLLPTAGRTAAHDAGKLEALASGGVHLLFHRRRLAGRQQLVADGALRRRQAGGAPKNRAADTRRHPRSNGHVLSHASNSGRTEPRQQARFTPTCATSVGHLGRRSSPATPAASGRRRRGPESGAATGPPTEMPDAPRRTLTWPDLEDRIAAIRGHAARRTGLKERGLSGPHRA